MEEVRSQPENLESGERQSGYGFVKREALQSLFRDTKIKMNHSKTDLKDLPCPKGNW